MPAREHTAARHPNDDGANTRRPATDTPITLHKRRRPAQCGPSYSWSRYVARYTFNAGRIFPTHAPKPTR